MKWVLYATALASAFFGIIAMVSGAFVFQQTAGIIMLLIGSTSFGLRGPWSGGSKPRKLPPELYLRSDDQGLGKASWCRPHRPGAARPPPPRRCPDPPRARGL